MFPFLFMMAFSLLLGLIINKNKQKGLYIIIVFGLLAYIAACRAYFIGVDTPQYFRAYRVIGLLDWTQVIHLRYEYGFLALCKLLNYISRNPQFLIAFSSIFIMSSVGFFIYKYSPNISLSSYLFIALASYSMYMNIMREAIAVAIILLGFPFLRNKRFLSFSVVVLVAGLFHTTALFCIVLIAVCQKKYTKRIFVTYIGVFALILFATKPILKKVILLYPFYNEYLDSEFDFTNYFGTLIIVAIYSLILAVGLSLYWTRGGREAFIKQPKWFKDFDLMAHMLSLIILTSIAGMQMNCLLRLKEYFMPSSWIWLPALFSLILTKKEKGFFVYNLIACAGLYFIIVNTYRPEWHGVVPYSFFWNRG